ncbi:MAG: M23 family metallopeptidase [Thermodesulfobacteriota bacterium]
MRSRYAAACARVVAGSSLLCCLFTVALVLAAPAYADAGDGKDAAYPRITLSSRTAIVGDPILLQVRVQDGERPRVLWMEKEIPMIPTGNQREWYGFLGVDLKARPGGYPLSVRALPSGKESRIQVSIKGKDYGERRLTLPREMVELDEPTLERVKREAEVLRRVLERSLTSPLWRGAFLRPCDGEVAGPFGRRSIINEQPRSPHSGVDLRGETGTPVKAINQGRVALTCEHFFSGRSVVIDHGGGIHSMYSHLDRIRVREQDRVGRGEVIGQVGSTGRSTGPHLHFAVRVNGARVNPLRLIELSLGLE